MFNGQHKCRLSQAEEELLAYFRCLPADNQEAMLYMLSLQASRVAPRKHITGQVIQLIPRQKPS